MYNSTNEEFPNIQICVIDFNDSCNSRYELWVYHNEDIPIFRLINENDKSEEYLISITEPKCYNQKHVFNLDRLKLFNAILKTETMNSTLYSKIVMYWNTVNSDKQINKIGISQPDYTYLN